MLLSAMLLQIALSRYFEERGLPIAFTVDSTGRYNTPAIEQGACLFQYGRFQQCALGRIDLLPSEQIEASSWRMVERHDLAFEREHPDARDGVIDAGAGNARKQGQAHLVQWLLQSSME